MTLASTACITLDRLEGACDDQRVMFQELFPNGFEATSEAACIAAARKHASVFDWDWAASRLLADPALEAYKSVKRPAWETYDATRRQAWKTYKNSNRQSREAYEDSMRPARKAYEAVERPALKIYKSVCADAFARAFWAQETTL